MAVFLSTRHIHLVGEDGITLVTLTPSKANDHATNYWKRQPLLSRSGYRVVDDVPIRTLSVDG